MIRDLCAEIRAEVSKATVVATRFKRNRVVAQLSSHSVVLRGDHVVLRPMTEDDWDVLLRWNNDQEVMNYAYGNPFEVSTASDIQPIYRWISTHAFCFMIEVGGAPIGECWLQRMNLQRILDQFPDKDLRRIDIMIGEKSFWGRGLGTDAIALLVDFGLGSEKADAILAPGVDVDNPRSLRAFEKKGFTLHAVVTETEDVTSGVGHDLILTRDQWTRSRDDPGV